MGRVQGYGWPTTVAAVETNRTASWLVKAGMITMAYDAAVGLALFVFGERVSPGWAVPSFLMAFVLFLVAAPTLAATGLYFALTSNLIAWAKLREQQPAEASR